MITLRITRECSKCKGHKEVVLSWDTNGVNKSECPACKGKGVQRVTINRNWLTCEIVKEGGA